ncbi:hypothetical protein [Aureimonas sp. AU40]|uniref:hypothetical protein n=1 Tax=Aureimonas sp. AU40 TaxID=1637747 RepID=UPI0007815A83|nr:hypothetical protein [Aureimonas sp. AU40]
MNKVRISAAIASKTGITLYLENGEEMNLPKDSWRTKAIMDEALEPLARHEIVEIDLDTFSVHTRIEKKTNGLVRFMRGAVSKIASALGITKDEPPAQKPVESDPVDPERPCAHTGASAPVTTPAPVEPDPVPAPTPVPAPAPVVQTADPKAPPEKPEEEELVAIVETPAGPKIIPGVEALEKQIERAAYSGNAVGFERFMQRIASVIDTRGHSVKELLNFMKKGDLPIADDGSIVGYKVLKTLNGRIVDCHSGKVPQRVGSRVSMAEKLVDPSRRTQCSTGLHIARRGYLHGFSGDVIMFVKVAPEDVIAVPHGEPDKMRAAAYHIVAQIPGEFHGTLRANRPITGDSTAAKMLADVIAGHHAPIIENVVIGAAYGGDVRVTPVAFEKDEPAEAKPDNGFAKALDDEQEGLSVKELNERINAAIDTTQAAAEVVEEAAEELEDEIAEEEADVENGEDTMNEALVPEVEEAPAAPEPVVETPAEPVETKAERDARRKREKRAAVAKTKVDRIAEKTDKDVKARPARQKAPAKAATAAPATALDPASKEGQRAMKDEAARKLFAEGKSLREIEKELKMCRKRLGKLLKP